MRNLKKGIAWVLLSCLLFPALPTRAEEQPVEGETSNLVESVQDEASGEENPEECTHTWEFDESEGSYDAEFHYQVCADCGEKKKEAHNFTSEFLGMKVCEAGCFVDPAQIETPEMPDEENPEECTHTWEFDESEGSYDLEFHYLVCAHCGEKKKEAHVLTGMQFLGMEVCSQGCLLNLGGEEGKEPIEEGSFPIEDYYSQRGHHAVKSVEVSCDEEGYSQYRIWYPADLEDSNATYPVIAMCNGTGSGYMEGMTDWEGYITHFEHIASWGFIVVANNESNSYSGQSAVKGVKLLLEWNNEEGNTFYRKVDEEKIGVTGHSQGGAGCLNAATKHGGEDIFKSIYSVSGAQRDLAVGLWGEDAAYDIGSIQVPCCFIAGIGAFEDIVIPLPCLQANYDAVREGVPAVMMRRKNYDHGDMLIKGDGYLIAWFLYTLCDDAGASKAFYGDDAEIIVNTNWQDVAVKSLREASGKNPEAPNTPGEEPSSPTQQNPVSSSSVQEFSDAESEAAAHEQLIKDALQQAGKLSSKTLKGCINTEFYSAMYPDLQEAFHGDAVLLKEHFLTYGLSEGRIAIPFLDIVKYRESNPDLQKAFGDDWNAYLKHYLVYGIKEGRSSCTYFDASAYVERYPDLKNAFGYNAVALFNHYVVYGMKEERNPAK